MGAGAWATTIANLLSTKGFDVRMWGKDRRLLHNIRTSRENKKYLSGVRLSHNLKITPSLQEAVRGADLVVLGIPIQFMRPIVRRVARYLDDNAVIVNLGKGIENKTFSRGSEIIRQETKSKFPIAVLSGPNIAQEIVKKIPSKSVISASDVRYLPWLQELFTTSYFKVFSNPDLVGVELSGALKNVIAILAGISDGLGYGDNTKSGIITRGLSEMMQFGIHFGANPNTFFGLAGMGDLVVTCSSPYSRNRTFGELIAKGRSPKEALRMLHGRIPEGFETSRAVFNLSQRIGISMPLSKQVYRILHTRHRSVREEFQQIWDTRAGSELV
jgi:glycerol-3-phosphate dehydrogenase (NAD(P)+)